MNGIRLVLDTNANISLIRGNKSLLDFTNKADFVGISIISFIEFLSFSNLSENDRHLFEEISKEAEILNINKEDHILINHIIQIWKDYRLKLPDAILVATAISNKSDLITNDKSFQKLQGLTVINF